MVPKFHFHYVELRISLKNTFLPPQKFYILQGLPYNLVIGHTTLTEWKAVLDWKNRTLTLFVKGAKVISEWQISKQPYWRHPIVLTVFQRQVIPPHTQKFIHVNRITENEWRGRMKREGLITPLRSLERLSIF